jgi:hypothetical protein
VREHLGIAPGSGVTFDEIIEMLETTKVRTENTVEIDDETKAKAEAFYESCRKLSATLDLEHEGPVLDVLKVLRDKLRYLESQQKRLAHLIKNRKTWFPDTEEGRLVADAMNFAEASIIRALVRYSESLGSVCLKIETWRRTQNPSDATWSQLASTEPEETSDIHQNGECPKCRCKTCYLLGTSKCGLSGPMSGPK